MNELLLSVLHESAVILNFLFYQLQNMGYQFLIQGTLSDLKYKVKVYAWSVQIVHHEQIYADLIKNDFCLNKLQYEHSSHSVCQTFHITLLCHLFFGYSHSLRATPRS